MPNWCEGNIRLRGTHKSIADFLKNELMFVATPNGNILGNIERELECKDEGDEIFLRKPSDVGECIWPSIYIKDTHRNFIESEEIELYVGDDVETVCIDDFKAAWDIDPTPYIEKAKRHGVDIRIVGFERGMQFMKTIEIVGGELVKNEETQFDDWDWECPMPNMGG